MISNRRIIFVLFVYAFLILTVSPVHAGVNRIGQGGDVFIGEDGLDITGCTGTATTIAWFRPGTSPSTAVPDFILRVDNPDQWYVSPGIFSSRTGLWYQWEGSLPAGSAVVNVLDPYLETGIISQATGNSVSYGNVPQGDFLNFHISTNMWTVTTRPGYDPVTDGIFSFKVSSPDGTIYSGLYQNASSVIPLTGISANESYVTWVPLAPPYNMNGWNTGITDPTGTLIYPPGIYEVMVETDLNGIRENYRDPDGADYTGKTVAYPKPVTIGSNTLTIKASAGSIVRGNQFSVTLKGMPSTIYLIWVKETGHMSGSPGDQPPNLLPSQSGLRSDPSGGPYQFGGYQYEGGDGKTVRDDVPGSPANGTPYYGRVSLSTTGSRTLQWQTNPGSRDRTYTIHVERGPPGPDGLPDIFSSLTAYTSADVNVRVEKGAVTIVAGREGEPLVQQEGQHAPTPTGDSVTPQVSSPPIQQVPVTTEAPLIPHTTIATPLATTVMPSGLFISLVALVIGGSLLWKKN